MHKFIITNVRCFIVGVRSADGHFRNPEVVDIADTPPLSDE